MGRSPSELLTTWKDIRDEFRIAFLPKKKITCRDAQIAELVQSDNESLSDINMQDGETSVEIIAPEKTPMEEPDLTLELDSSKPDGMELTQVATETTPKEWEPDTIIHNGLVIREANFGSVFIAGYAPTKDNSQVKPEQKPHGKEIICKEGVEHCHYLSAKEYGEERSPANAFTAEPDDEILPNLLEESNLTGQILSPNPGIIEHEVIATRLHDILVPTNPSGAHERVKRQDEAYRGVTRGLAIIGDSVERDYLIKHNEHFKERYVIMIVCKECYESKRRRDEPGRPPPWFLPGWLHWMETTR